MLIPIYLNNFAIDVKEKMSANLKYLNDIIIKTFFINIMLTRSYNNCQKKVIYFTKIFLSLYKIVMPNYF